jgi:hypothetical protein
MVWRNQILILLALLGILLSACGGGGEGVASATQEPQPSLPAKTLSWEPPASFTDGTPLNPVADLQDFEIYVSQNSSFGPTDQTAAVVAPADRSFNLTLLASSLSRGTTYYVSLRAVSTSGMKSDFSPPASFSF